MFVNATLGVIMTKELEVLFNYINTISIDAKSTNEAAARNLRSMKTAAQFIRNLINGGTHNLDNVVLNDILHKSDVAVNHASSVYAYTTDMLSLARQTERNCRKVVDDHLGIE